MRSDHVRWDCVKDETNSYTQVMHQWSLRVKAGNWLVDNWHVFCLTDHWWSLGMYQSAKTAWYCQRKENVNGRSYHPTTTGQASKMCCDMDTWRRSVKTRSTQEVMAPRWSQAKRNRLVWCWGCCNGLREMATTCWSACRQGSEDLSAKYVSK